MSQLSQIIESILNEGRDAPLYHDIKEFLLNHYSNSQEWKFFGGEKVWKMETDLT